MREAAGRDTAQRPPSLSPGLEGASTRRKAAQSPPMHWARATPRSAPGGRQHLGCGCYGQVGPQASLIPIWCLRVLGGL